MHQPQPKTFNDLPDEIVCHVLTQISSMGDKLRMGRVSHRLNRCTNEHLWNSTWPLELHSTRSHPWNLGGVDVHSLITRMILTMTRKTFLSELVIHLHDSEEEPSIERFCRLLIERATCLSKTTEFKFSGDRKSGRTMQGVTMFHTIISGHPDLPEIVYEILTYYRQLQVLHISNTNLHFLKLAASLNGKSLTEIVLQGLGVSSQALVQVFSSPQPNTLKTVKLGVRFANDDPNSGIAPFFQQMSNGPWSAVESLDYDFTVPIHHAADFNLMGDLLNMFPNLLNCSPHSIFSFRPTAQHYIECIDRFLKSAESRRSCTKQTITYGQYNYLRWPACNVALVMGQIMDRGPERSCQLTFEGKSMDNHDRLSSRAHTATLRSHGHASFKLTNLVISDCQGNPLLGEAANQNEVLIQVQQHHHFHIMNPNFVEPAVAAAQGQPMNPVHFIAGGADEGADDEADDVDDQEQDDDEEPPDQDVFMDGPMNANNNVPMQQWVMAPHAVQQGQPAPGPCAVCRRFYGNTINQIKHKIRQQQGGHLEHYFMNPCQAHRMQDEVAGTQVEVNRDPETGRYTLQVDELRITVDAQPCIVPGCVECLENMK